MSATAETQVCVVGAGVMGASAAFHLAERGLEVLVIEKAAPGSEASGATAGTLALQNKHLAAIPLVLRAIEMWGQLGETLGASVEYERRGGFRVAHTNEDVLRLEQAVRAQQALGVPVEILYQPQIAAEAPYLSPAIQAATYCPMDGMASPFATLRALLRAATRRGASLWSGCAVKGIEARGDHEFVVRTDRGGVRCAYVLAAAGAWNLEVAQMAGVALPIATELLQVLIADSGPPLFPHIVTHIRGNLTLKQQRPSGKILIGGAWKGEGNRETGVKRIRRESLLGNLRWASETIPAVARTRVMRGWVGFEGRSPDKLLMCGPVGSPAGFHVLGVAAGGFTLSPVAGLIAAEYIATGHTTVHCEPFHVKRFLGAAAARPPLPNEPAAARQLPNPQPRGAR